MVSANVTIRPDEVASDVRVNALDGEAIGAGVSAEFDRGVMAPHVDTNLPARLELATLRDRRLGLKHPIVVEMSREGDVFVASSAEFEEFGEGSTRGEAIADLQRCVAELYIGLEQAGDALGSDLMAMRERLRDAIEVRYTLAA